MSEFSLYASQGFFPDYYPEETEDVSKEKSPKLEKSTEEVDVGLIGGLEHSVIGTSIREYNATEAVKPHEQVYLPLDPFSAIPNADAPRWMPTNEEVRELSKKCNWNEEAVDHILREARSSEDIEPLYEIYKQNRDYQVAQAKAGVFSALTSGIGMSLGNPFDLLTIGVGATSTVPKAIATGAFLSAGSTFAQEYGTGIDEDITCSSVMGGAILGGISAVIPVAKGFSKLGNAGDTAIETAYKGSLINNSLYKTGYNVGKLVHDTTPEPVARWLGEQKQRLYNMNQGFSLEGFTDKVLKTEVGKRFFNKAYYSQKGRKASDTNITVQAPRNELLAEDYLNRDNIEQRIVSDAYSNACRQIKGFDMSFDKFQQAFYDALGGKLSKDNPLMSNHEFKKALEAFQGYLNEAHGRLGGAGVYVGKVDNYDAPRMIDFRKITNYMKKAFPDLPYAKAREKMIGVFKNLLLRSLDDYDTRLKLLNYWQRKTGREVTNNPLPHWDDFDEFIKWTEEQALKDATGYVDQSKSLVEDLGKDTVFASEYSRERTPWDFSIRNEEDISLNYFRIDPLQCLSAYGRKVTGDLCAVKVWGVKPRVVPDKNGGSMLSIKGELRKKGAEVVEAEIKNAPPSLVESTKEATQRGVNALIRTIYRTAESEYDSSRSGWSALADIIKNLSFMTSSGYMGLLNLTEQAEAVKAYGATFMLKSLPVIAHKFSSWSKGQLTPQENRELLSIVFGYDVRGLRIWDETYQRTAFKYGEGSLKTLLVAGTSQLSEWMPTTRFLNATQESISKKAQDLFFGELLQYSFRNRGSSALKVIANNGEGFLSQETLLRAGISVEDFEELHMALVRAFDMTEDGMFAIHKLDALMDNHRALFALRRLGNYVSTECIQHNTLANTMLWQGSKASPILNLLFQFKTFALASFNNRLLKSWNRFKEGDVIGQAQTHVLSGALAGLGLLAQSTAKTAGMSEEQRKKWWKSNYGIESLDEANKETFTKFFLNAGLRSGLYASLSLPISMMWNPSIKSTTSAWSYRDKPTAGELVADLFPASRTVNSLIGLGWDAMQYMDAVSTSDDDMRTTLQRRRERERASKAFARDIRNLTPHIDVLRNIGLGIAYDAIEGKKEE